MVNCSIKKLFKVKFGDTDPIIDHDGVHLTALPGSDTRHSEPRITRNTSFRGIYASLIALIVFGFVALTIDFESILLQDGLLDLKDRLSSDYGPVVCTFIRTF